MNDYQLVLTRVLVQKGHGVPLGLLDGVREVGREFFSLPREEKLQISMSSASGYR